MTAPRMFGLEMLSDPYPIYERLRAAHPVFYAEELRAWLVTSYDAVNTALRSPQFSSERYPRMKQVLAKRGFGELVDDRMRSMLHMDAPDHTRLRSLVNKAFHAQNRRGHGRTHSAVSRSAAGRRREPRRNGCH